LRQSYGNLEKAHIWHTILQKMILSSCRPRQPGPPSTERGNFLGPMSRARFRDETLHLRAIGEGDFSNPEGLRYLCNGTGKLSDLSLPLHHPPSPPPASSIQHFSFQRFSFTKTPLFSRTPLFPRLRPGHWLFQRPSPQKQIPSNTPCHRPQPHRSLGLSRHHPDQR
jgi:hypothetical protein